MKRKLTLRKSAVIAALAVAGALLASVGCKNGADDEPAPIAVESVELSSSSLTLEPGETYTLSASVTPWNADDKTVTWSSSDTDVAMVVNKVVNNGDVLAIKRGSATITARVGDKQATCTVTVKTIAVENIVLDYETLELVCYEGAQLKATVTPDNADDKNVSWSSSNTDVVKVYDTGTIYPLLPGTATITAQAGGKEARCQVIVKSRNNTTPDSGSQSDTTHVHNYSGGLCTVCGFQKPFMVDATIDDSGVLTNYRGSESRVDIPDGVTGIGSNAFEGCESLVVVKIPSSVTAIGSCAFKGCKNLYDIRMSKGVTSIGSYAFQDCIGFTSVTIPASVKNIGRSAFQDCRELGRVSMSKGVECIENYAFSSCKSLYSVYIPSSVTSIGYEAFGSCDKLTSMQYDGTETEWNLINLYSSLKGKKIIGKDKNGDVTTWTSAR